MTNILVTGVSGLLGLNLALVAHDLGYKVVGWTHRHPLDAAPFHTEQMDLADLKQIPARISALAPDIIIHCAALADIDESEQHPDLADCLNAQVPAQIAEASVAMRLRLVHISTDAVFDGTKGDYRESDPPNPISTYASTKLAGEYLVAQVDPTAIIARVNFYGWSLNGKRSLAEFFFRHLQAEQSVHGFTDVFFSPLYAPHLAQVLLQMTQTNLQGLYHVFSTQAISKHAFGISLARQFELDETLISPLSVSSSGLTAPRSLDLSMNTEKFRTDFHGNLPDQPAGLQGLYSDWRSGLPEKLKSFIALNSGG